MTKSEIQTEAEKTEVRLLPARRDQNTTMALVAIGRSRSFPSAAPEPPAAPAADPHLLTDADVRLFQQGTHFRLYEKLGAHSADGGGGARCAIRRLGA